MEFIMTPTAAASLRELDFTFIDLFAGIGGLRLGIEAVGGTCVFSSEWDRYCQKTYSAWHGEVPHGDINAIDIASIPDHYLLAAGFPCQPFSIAGVSKKNALGRPHGFKDATQGTLFFRLATIIQLKRPPVLLLENVKNLRSHDRGRTWEVIKGTLDDLNYRVFDRSAGVEVTRLERFLYRVSYGGRSVEFELNDLSNVKPPAYAIAPDEIYIGPIFDDSALRFFLIYNPRLKIFHYVLDETARAAEQFMAARQTRRILIGKRTGFAFYRDLRRDRKILIGVFEGNARVNNAFDGPFDQLPDNFIEGDVLQKALIEVEPTLAGRIDRYGGLADGSGRFLIGPYAYYRTEQDLMPFHACAIDKTIPAEDYYACFVMDVTSEATLAVRRQAERATQKPARKPSLKRSKSKR